MVISEIKIRVAFFDKDEMPEGAKLIFAQTNDYPIRNGSGHTLDEAIEDLCLQIVLFLHNKRTGRRNG